MTLLPLPRVGAVIRHGYLWHREALQGRTLGAKDRPCLIAWTRAVEAGVQVGVVPITRSVPTAGTEAFVMPTRTKARLGLDPVSSWIVIDEANVFVWPGFDTVATAAGEPCYGDLPHALVRQVREAMATRLAAGRLATVERDDARG